MNINFFINDTTLREGEQFHTACFNTDDKIRIAELLCSFGIPYIELSSPAVSLGTQRDIITLKKRRLPAKIATHIRCHNEDIRKACDCGVDSIHIYYKLPHGILSKDLRSSIKKVTDEISEKISIARQNLPTAEIRFSIEDIFRFDIDAALLIYKALEATGLITRFCVSDTSGTALPDQIKTIFNIFKMAVNTPLGFHGHNDIGLAAANTLCALQNGARFIDVSVLGIGERTGITPLESLIAILYSIDKEDIRKKYRLQNLAKLSNTVASIIRKKIPFNIPITSKTAFTHKAGVHSASLLRNEKYYEALNPEDFSRRHSLLYAHKLTGKHAVNQFCKKNNIPLNAAQCAQALAIIKDLADQKKLNRKNFRWVLLDCSK